ncbi:hypothetical protein AXG93_2587s1090 [Marchantia polymorpha subsp. ruderalis]|uniref:Uncharacterized protein n=1 Tax=Marchantia polymorpha subsp. ruderalis TaxID=1480154 RepID=A0A176WRD4_MARPO|nr:hypothetical protein AXG93_2587s1090 [Marchantia polymorpha subsp. ruderalis]
MQQLAQLTAQLESRLRQERGLGSTKRTQELARASCRLILLLDEYSSCRQGGRRACDGTQDLAGERGGGRASERASRAGRQAGDGTGREERREKVEDWEGLECSGQQRGGEAEAGSCCRVQLRRQAGKAEVHGQQQQQQHSSAAGGWAGGGGGERALLAAAREAM